MFKLEKLKSGLRVLKIPVAGVESISCVVMVKAGSRLEDEPADYGVAHFLEHMVFKGTTKYADAKAITERIDGIGAVFNAFTGQEMTAFYIRSAAKDVAVSLDMLGQMTTQMSLRQEEIDKERGVIVEEMHMYEDQPSNHNADEFAQMFYGESGLAHNIVGTRESIAAINRPNFVKFVNRWYQPANMLLVIAGKKDVVLGSETQKMAEESFQFRSFAQPAWKPEAQWVKNFVYGGLLNFIDRQTEQVHFMLGWTGLTTFDKRDAAMGLLRAILGGNMSSRLFSQVREKRGLCYYIHANSDAFGDAGYFGAAAGVNPEKLVEAVKVSVGEFYDLASGRKALTDEELERAKNFSCGQMTLAQESVHSLALHYGEHYLFHDEVEEVAAEIERYQKVTKEEVVQLARELLVSSELRLSAIGNISEQQKSEIEKIVWGK